MKPRHTLTRSVFALATAGLLAVSLAACGGESLSDAEKPTDGGKAASYTNDNAMPIPDEEKAKSVLEKIEVNEELAALVPAEVRDTGLRVTTSVGYPPMEEWGTNGTDIIGIDPSFAHAISRTLGLEMSMEDQEFASMIPGLISKRYDMLISSMTDNEERRETTTFVDYVQAGNAFLVAKGNPEGIKVPEDLCGKTVAVVDSGSSALLAQDFSKQCTDAGKEAYKILSLVGDQEANLSVKSGRSVATITDFPVAVNRAEDPESGLEAIRIEGDESTWGIGFDNSRKDLAEVVQKAMQSLQDDGTYAAILDAYGVGDMAVPSITINLK